MLAVLWRELLLLGLDVEELDDEDEDDEEDEADVEDDAVEAEREGVGEKVVWGEVNVDDVDRSDVEGDVTAGDPNWRAVGVRFDATGGFGDPNMGAGFADIEPNAEATGVPNPPIGVEGGAEGVLNKEGEGVTGGGVPNTGVPNEGEGVPKEGVAANEGVGLPKDGVVKDGVGVPKTGVEPKGEGVVCDPNDGDGVPKPGVGVPKPGVVGWAEPDMGVVKTEGVPNADPKAEGWDPMGVVKLEGEGKARKEGWAIGVVKNGPAWAAGLVNGVANA